MSENYNAFTTSSGIRCYHITYTLKLKVKLSRYCQADEMEERNYSSYSFLTSAL